MEIQENNYIKLSGVLLGAVAFFLLYGTKILDPSFIGWTMHHDAGQHFIGWHFFRSEPWAFPIGSIKTLNYPQGTSLVYMDSIPLLAVPLKLVSSLLPDVFQYHGIWLLLCYILQGYFASILLKKITDNYALILVSIPFLILFPVMIFRSLPHEALSGHFIILASLLLYFESFERNTKLKWVVLLSVSLLVHFYLFVMSFAFFSAFILREIIKGKKGFPGPIIGYSVGCLLAILIVMWVSGYFVIAPTVARSGYFGFFSMNLISPINPAPETSLTFLKPFPLATEGQYEGFNYLGLGVLLMILIALYEFFKHGKSFNRTRYLPLLTVCFLLFLFSLSHKVTFSNAVVFEIPLDEKTLNTLGILRSSGRFFWPVAYVLVFLSISVLIRYNSKRCVFVLLLVLLCIQTIDYFPFYRAINHESITWNSPLKSRLWGNIADKKSHMVFIPPETNVNEFIPFAYLAGNHGCTINVTYAARAEGRHGYRQELISDFQSGKVQKDAFYIVNDLFLSDKNFVGNYAFGELDGYHVYIPEADDIEFGSDFHEISKLSK